MRKIMMLTVSVLLIAASAGAQTYKSRDGYISFNPNKDQSHKDYAAASKEATALFKVEASEVALLVPMKTFHFNNALLEEHFNENYLHTDKFPNASYKGKLSGFSNTMLTKDGVYNLTSEGQFTMHGVTKSFNAPVKLEVKGKAATFTCDFKIKAEDFKIDIPGIVKPKMADETPISAVVKFQLN